VCEKLGDVPVRGPEAELSLDGKVRVADACVRLRPRMRASWPPAGPREGDGRRGEVTPLPRTGSVAEASSRTPVAMAVQHFLRATLSRC